MKSTVWRKLAMPEENLTSGGYPFTFDPEACRKCPGRCCNGETGFVWVTPREIRTIAEFLKMDTQFFIDTRLRKVGYRFVIKELKSGENYACLFFDDEQNACSIYPVRPEQCQTYPFWTVFKQNSQIVIDECPGVSAI